MTAGSPLGAIEVLDVWSSEVGETFRLFVGECGAEPEVTLIVTDGNGLFGLAVDTVRLMQIPALLPSMLVVGIGYPGAAVMADTIDVRNRDLAPTHWPAFPGSGGADKFLAFICGSLLERIAHRTPSCLDRIVYFGHSLGGLFGTVALLEEPPPFTDYILSSPSLFWSRYHVFDREEQRAATRADLPAKVFFGIGALETDEGRRLEGRNLPAGHPRKPPATHLDMVADLLRFTDRLRARGYPSLDLEMEVYPDEFHNTVPCTVLSRGLRHLFFGY